VLDDLTHERLEKVLFLLFRISLVDWEKTGVRSGCKAVLQGEPIFVTEIPWSQPDDPLRFFLWVRRIPRIIGFQIRNRRPHQFRAVFEKPYPGVAILAECSSHFLGQVRVVKNRSLLYIV
jgi:hypothetical protein